ncbi:MAG: hypothetical protein K2L00_04535, partial [Muribaculaceae bacterium]|nr:hypothetical protein [Muribaculaceae bacterium]
NYTGVGDMAGVIRITLAGLHLNLILATAASALFFFCGHTLTGFFSPDEEVLASAGLLILPLVLYQYGDAIQLTFANGLRGTGYVRPFLWVTLIAYILIGVPMLLWLATGLDMGNVGVYYSFSFALFAAAALYYIYFRNTVKRMAADIDN